MTPSRDIGRLIEIMAALRAPGTGCPWDLVQDFARKDELGDLLLQVVFHARMAQEQDAFDFGDVVESITRKLLRRHPHVFGEARGLSPEAVEGLWHRVKEEEKAERAAARGDAPSARTGALAGVPSALPALTRALKLQEKASRVGFDWNDPKAVLDKIREETEEVAEAIAEGDKAHAVAEVGDLLFVVVNLARHLGADPERALRETNLKFERRFGAIERALAQQGRVPEQATLAEMDALWNEAKKTEKEPVKAQNKAKQARR